jgi:hypothetical protein
MSQKKSTKKTSALGGYPEPIDLNQITTRPISSRANKVKLSDMATPLSASGARRFLDSLPNQLKGADLRRFITLALAARDRGLPFHWMMGAHVIKVGLSPIVIDLMKRQIITGVSFNGAGVIHDLELAFWSGTSEDVQSGLNDGSFGMARETAELFREALDLAAERDCGLGQAAGELIRLRKAPNARLSILAEAARLKLPATIHVGIGTDIVAQHPSFSGALAGESSHRDFRLLATVAQNADRGGVFVNIGSTSLLPEVFLKALTVARNISRSNTRKIITANFDMIRSYRPSQNVVQRPTQKTGAGFEFIGHHEITIPLLAWGLKGMQKKNT